MFDNISVPGAVAIAILVVLVLIVIVRNIYSATSISCSSPRPMWWSAWARSTPCGAWASI